MLDSDFSLGIDACDMNPSEIQHCPPKLLSLRISYNLSVNGVVVDISLQTKMLPKDVTKRLIKQTTYIVLNSCLGFQPRIAYLGIIQIVERGHPKTLLGKGPE